MLSSRCAASANQKGRGGSRDRHRGRHAGSSRDSGEEQRERDGEGNEKRLGWFNLPSGTESSSREVSVTGFKRLLTFISIFGLTRGVCFLLLRGRGFLGSDPHHHHHRCEDCGWCSQFSQHCGSSPFSSSSLALIKAERWCFVVAFSPLRFSGCCCCTAGSRSYLNNLSGHARAGFITQHLRRDLSPFVLNEQQHKL